MEPIEMLIPPKQAFNKHRPMSDLIKKQVEHFKHLEAKLPKEVREALPQHRIITEDDAARYIAPITQFLRSGKMPAGAPAQTRPSTVTSIRPERGLSIAAVADVDNAKSSGKPRPTAKKKSSTKSKKSSSSSKVKR